MVALIDAQAGSAVVGTLIAQFVIAAPFGKSVVGVTVIIELTVPVVPVAPVKLIVGMVAATTRVTFETVDAPTEFVAVTA